MFLIARAAQELASWDNADGEAEARKKSLQNCLAQTFSQKAERHEYVTGTKSGIVHLHRQMDTQGFILT
jgi:hypothetical protein